MRAFKGVNLKTIDDPATRTAMQALDQYARQTGRALSRSVGGGQAPPAITIVVPPQPGQSGDFKDSTWVMTDNDNASKRMKFELSGIETGATRTLTCPNANGTIALTSQIPSALPVPIADGGTGQTSASAAINALLPSKTGNSLKTLRVKFDESDVEWGTGSGARLRLISFPVGNWTSNTITTLGTEPDAAGKIELLPVVFTRTHLIMQFPQDYVSTPTLTIFCAGSSTDSAQVDYWVYTRKLVLGSTLVTSAYDNADFAIGSPGGVTDQIYNTNINITGSFVAGDLVRITLERDGVTDSNLDTQFFFGASFYYIADS